MTTTTLSVPQEPLATAHSANGNIHRLSRVSPGVLELEPGRADWWAALVSLAFFPIVLAVCIAMHAEMRLTVGLSLSPLFGAGGFGVGAFCYHRFGTRARFDRDRHMISVTGLRHGEGLRYSWDDIRAVQFCDAGRKHGEGAWHAYQVNLVVGSTTVSRINLLDSGGKKKLHRIAKEIADFIGVPFYVGSNAAEQTVCSGPRDGVSVPCRKSAAQGR